MVYQRENIPNPETEHYLPEWLIKLKELLKKEQKIIIEESPEKDPIL
ncbi:hypothetical protein J4444_01045 [Candidatus Woesearchaeota archaeon]|nr:hypothetical protein [uncultured archaeon]MBS3165685.1 hypothetical protein [Candidatus Woesearchaeota archaeon]